MMDDWQAVSLSADDITMGLAESASMWLESKGLGRHAAEIIEETDAEKVEDFKLLDMDMVEVVIKAVGLKMVAAQKFRLAMAELRGEGGPAPEAERSPEMAPPLSEATLPTAPDAAAAASPERPVEECIAICIDRSGSMGTPFAEVTLNVVHGETRSSVAERTRMEAVKAMFYAFRDRLESLGRGRHQLGLLQFDSQVEQMLDVTGRLDRFESIVDDLDKRGQTAIYSAIVQAAGMLGRHFAADSPTDLRILVLTDGQSNTGSAPEEALEAVNRIGAVVDAIIVGNTPDSNLRKIVHATEGECYQINSLGEGFELLEAEGVVSLRARRGGTDKPAFRRRAQASFSSISEKALTQGAAVQRAPALAAELAAKAVVNVSSLVDRSSVATSASRSGSLKRLMKELRQIASGDDGCWFRSGEGVHVFPAPDNLKFWRALIEGRSDSPFAGGVFVLNVILPDNYPFSPPKITFETPIYHCNVSDSGGICLDILRDSWNPALSVPKCLEAIRVMMANPDTDNALRQWIAELTVAHYKFLGTDTPDTRYYDKARECTSQHAMTTVEAWKQRWGC